MWIDSGNQEEDKNQQGNLNSPSVGAGGGTAATPTNTSIPGANPSTINPIQSNQPQQKFATVQDYLGANKQQGEALGSDFANKLSQSANTEKSAIDTAAQQTQSDINAGTTSFNQDLVNQAKSNPTSVANSPDQLKQFLGQWNAAYTGPSSFETSNNYIPAAAAANEASQKAAEVGTAGGREQLLGDTYGVYGQGNKGLDQAILQQSSEFPTIQAAQPAFKSIQDYLGSQSTALAAQAQKAAADTAAAKAQTQGTFANNLTNFQNDLNSRVAAARQSATDVGSKWKQDLASGDTNAIAADLKTAGVSDQDIKNLTSYLNSYNTEYGKSATGNYSPNIDLSQAYKFNPNVSIGPENVASAQDYANAAALQKLTGVDYSGVLNPANVTQAGTAGNPNQLDVSQVTPQLKAQLDEKDKEFLAQPVNIGQDLKNMADPTLATQYAQKYIDAATRQGQDLKNNPILNNLATQAYQTYLKYYGTRPDVQKAMWSIMNTLQPYTKPTLR